MGLIEQLGRHRGKVGADPLILQMNTNEFKKLLSGAMLEVIVKYSHPNDT